MKCALNCVHTCLAKCSHSSTAVAANSGDSCYSNCNKKCLPKCVDTSTKHVTTVESLAAAAEAHAVKQVNEPTAASRGSVIASTPHSAVPVEETTELEAWTLPKA